MTASITQLDITVIERILDTGRGAGYVLDFSDADYGGFFRDFGVDIFGDLYAGEGNSKGKRLRAFLRATPPPLSGCVLAALLKHRTGTSATTDGARSDHSNRAYVAGAGSTAKRSRRSSRWSARRLSREQASRSASLTSGSRGFS